VPLTTEGLIDELRRFRSDKLALVALIGSMGAENERDALARLREIRGLADSQLTALRRKRKAEWSKQDRLQKPIWEGIFELTTEVEPWLAQIAEGGAK
jgi:hypothetical protein